MSPHFNGRLVYAVAWDYYSAKVFHSNKNMISLTIDLETVIVIITCDVILVTHQPDNYAITGNTVQLHSLVIPFDTLQLNLPMLAILGTVWNVELSLI